MIIQIISTPIMQQFSQILLLFHFRFENLKKWPLRDAIENGHVYMVELKKVAGFGVSCFDLKR